MGVPVTKQELRSRLRASRRGSAATPGSTDRRARAGRVADLVLADPDVVVALAAGRPVAAYCSMPTEPPTDELLERLLARGLPALLPVVVGDGVLDWVRDDGDASRRPDRWGIPTPAGPPVGRGPAALVGVDVIVVPALAVDESGRRLGQGGGFYDRLLAGLLPHAEGGPLRLAVVGPGEVLADGAIPAEDHDERVDRWVVA